MAKENNNWKGKYVVVRSHLAGVFIGKLENKQGTEIELSEAIRIWRWAGAASLSQLATEGTTKPSNCKFGVMTNELISDYVELIESTEAVHKSIKDVTPWRC